MTPSLPLHPSLENLKKQAKALLRKWLARDPETLDRVRAAHPKFARAPIGGAGEAAPRLSDCQLVLAREAGFESWPRLKVAVQAANQEAAAEFVELACLCYDDPHFDHRSFHARAQELLESRPELAEGSTWAAAAAGDARVVERMLREDPALVNRRGPHGWTPLYCACYSRVPLKDAARSTLLVAKVLLDRGADPNTYTLKQNDPPGSHRARRFTALTGVFGGGSTGLANQPPHPQWRELAELLLSRGADPADEQALWINQGAALEILLRHGLKADETVRTEDGDVTLLGRELCQAARGGHLDRVKLLLAHGARTGETFRGRTPWGHAMESGNLEIARVLEEAGAPAGELNDVERFASLCLAADGAGARAMLQADPGLFGRAPRSMVNQATNTGRVEAVRLALELGFDPDFVDEVAALHNAAGGGKEEIVRLLLERGASLTVREPYYDGTPVEWADFFDRAALRETLLSEGPICLFDAVDYGRPERVPDILARDPDALERPFARCLTREPRPEDWVTPLARAVERGRTAVVRALLDRGADAGARFPDGRSLVEAARGKGFEEIAAMLEGWLKSG